jgi:GNAT superfamily N-acetyltransferase
MNTNFITLNKENIGNEHICCAFSDKKCKESYELKKEWLKKEFDNGYVFRRLDERAKVFIEYGPAEKAWIPVDAPNYLMINCFWVSGQYKGQGYAKALLQSVLDDARQQGKDGLVTVVGTTKLPFMSDTKWLLRQGFETVEKLGYGFSLLAVKINPQAANVPTKTD